MLASNFYKALLVFYIKLCLHLGSENKLVLYA